MKKSAQNKGKRYTLRNYFSYLKDNPQRYWFKRKLYGWGWVPATREGWLVLTGFMGILLVNGFYLSSQGDAPTEAALLLFFAVLFFSAVALILICYLTGEKPRWSWGR